MNTHRSNDLSTSRYSEPYDMATEHPDDDAVLVSLPWTPTMSEFEALKDAMPKMDSEFDYCKKFEQMEAMVKSMTEEHEDKIREMHKAFEAAFKKTNDFLIITANHVEELQHRLNGQERRNDVLKEDIEDLNTRLISWDEWKEVTSEWSNSLMTMLFGDTVMNDGPQVNILQGWTEQSPV